MAERALVDEVLPTFYEPVEGSEQIAVANVSNSSSIKFDLYRCTKCVHLPSASFPFHTKEPVRG